MKIVWFSHRDLDHPMSGGAERTIYEIGKRLVNKGHELVWVSSLDNSDVHVKTIDGIILKKFNSNVKLHLATHQVIKEEIPDIIVDDLGHAIPWGSEIISKVPGIVFFRHLHRRSLRGQVSTPLRISISLIERLYPFIYRSWPFVVESNSSLDDLIGLGVAKEKIFKVPPGVETDYLTPSKKSDIPTIVYFGGFRDYKRPWDVLFTFKNIMKVYPSARLVMIGSGPSLQKTKKISEKLGIKEYVTFTGRLDRVMLMKTVSRAWVNVHTSITEGFGYSILEASSMGVPTVAYKVNGVVDSIKEGINGLLARDGDVTSLAEKIIEIISTNMNDLSISSRSFALTYSWESTASKWDTLLNELVKNYV